ncbi:E3 ubiquitin-protein ligase traf7 [Basidiobolus ranarum]|uniref:E3 ubiquitin-protein ligase traf7 n=1 Tax=Basidiobolus ranarum TaxID=34480 RepID=A0ABR2VNR2_9FUNG
MVLLAQIMEANQDIEFVSPPSLSLQCPICHDVCKDPLITSVCNHSYCAACIYQSLDLEPFCPLCRTRIQHDMLHSNLALNSVIGELPVYCPNKKYGCLSVIRHDTHKHHVAYCLYTPGVCEHSSLGCNFKGPRKDIEKHMKECVFEKFKAFIEKSNSRIQQLEEKVTEQGAELKRLNWVIEHSQLSTKEIGEESPQSPHALLDDSLKTDLDWIHGDIVCQRTISHHACGVTSLAYSSGKLYAGAHDGSTKIFEPETGDLIEDLHGHSMSVWALAVHQESNRFFSAGSDGTIKAWESFEDGSECIGVLNSHTHKVYGLLVSNNRVFSASSDKTIKVWNPLTLENVATFSGHTNHVNAIIDLYDGRIASAGSDHTVRIWDVSSGQCLQTINIGNSEVLDCSAGDGLLFASTYDSLIHVYDLNDFNGVKTLSGHNWEVWQLSYARNALFSASFDHTVKRWDTRNWSCDATLKGHKAFVHAMTLGDNNLITGCADRTIKIWK